MKIANNRRISINNYPDAFITINKNRVRVYENDSIFLKHNTEFEIEFDNRTTDIWMAKIKLNGEWTSESGLVLRPGEHVFLDTPNLDSIDKNRFLFETYKIEKGREDITKDNGLVEIFFYKKSLISNSIIWTNITSRDNTIPYSPTTYPTYPEITYSSMMNVSVGVNNIMSTDMEETGRIADGQESDQNFHITNDEFESFSSYSVHYKILPKSKKQVTIQDVVQYCSECGRRRRKNQNFCPSCGKKF